LSAQQTTGDEINNDPIENDEILIDEGERYHIANVWLPNKGDYQIDNRMYQTNIIIFFLFLFSFIFE